MKIFPEYEKNGNTFRTTVRKLSKETADGYFLCIVKSEGIEQFMKEVYFNLLLGKYAPGLIDVHGTTIMQIDTDQQSEENRIINLYC